MARYALVVGIADYTCAHLPKLSKPAEDAAAIATLLKQSGNCERVTELTGAVTYKKLGEALRTLLTQQAVNHEAIIYFTGHGISVTDELGASQSYLAPSDCQVTVKDGQPITQERAIPIASLNELIHKSQLSSLVMLIDACHSGAWIEQDLMGQSFSAFTAKQDYVLITACRGFEQAWAKKSEPHSIFTGAVLAGLTPNHADTKGYITVDRLFDYLSHALQGSRQEPLRFGKGRSIPIVRFQPEPKLITVSEECPYQGLEAFTPETQQFFYGRQAVVDLLLEHLQQFNVVPVIGSSGSGKSSVVRAGLIPSLGKNWQVLEPIKPDVSPMAALQRVLTSLVQRPKDKQQIYRLLEQEGLVAVLELIASIRQNQDKRILLVIDQFEEVFTDCPREEERTQFINSIAALQTLDQSLLAIVTTMRADFVEAWLDYGELVKTIQHQAVWLGQLQGDDLVQAIEQPTQDQGYHLGAGLLDLIVDDVQAEKNCLPLLEFALTELWQRRDQEQLELPLSAYRDMQRLTGVLNKRAEEVYTDDLKTDEEREWARRICLELVRIGPDVKDTRQRQPRQDLVAMGQSAAEQETIEQVIEALIQGRLLVTDRSAAAQADTNGNVVDLAHETLMTGWERFAKWRQANRDRRRLMQRLRDAELEWSYKEQDNRYLLQGGLLAEVRELWPELEPELPFTTQGFYQRSNQQEQDQIAFLEYALAEAELREKALRVTNLLTVSPFEAAAKGIQIVGESDQRLHGCVLTPVFSGLKKIFTTVSESGKLSGHEDSVLSVTFSPDSQTIVSGSTDCSIRRWDVQGNPIGKPFQGHEAAVWSVAFSPNGQTIASGSDDHSIRLWDLVGNEITTPFQGHKDSVWSVAFSPNGQTIVSGSHDCSIRLWDLVGNEVAAPFQGHEADVWSVAFSPDGQTIVSGSYDRTIRLWDLQGNPIGKPFQGHEAAVWSVAFSPNGQTIVSGSADRTIRLWDLQGNPIGKPFQGHEDYIWSVAFSPDGQTIVSSSYDRTIRLWDLQGNPIGKPFQGHTAVVWSATFSPDGQILVSGSDDRTIRLWDLQGNPIGKPFQGHENSVSSVNFSSDGQTIVSGSDDRTIRLWDLQGNPIGKPFQGHEDYIWSVAFSPDGQTIVSSSYDRTIRLWDLQGNPIGKPFQGHTAVVWSATFSPDGQTIVSGSYDRTIRLWDLQGNPIGKPFQGHKDSVWSVTFSPDGQTIVSSSADRTIRLWDLQGNPIGESFQGHEDSVLSVTFSPDGQTIVSGSADHTIRLWDLQGNLIGESFQGHKDSVWSVTFSPNGQTVVSSSADHTIRLWDLRGNPIGEPFQGHEGSVLSVTFSPDGQTIASGSADRTIRLWRGGTWHDWLALCCNRFRHHPLFKKPDREPFISACQVCEAYVWGKKSPHYK